MIANPLLYIIIGLSLLCALLLLWIIHLEIRLGKVFRGTKAKNLESVFADMGGTIDSLLKKSESVDQTLTHFQHKFEHDLSRCHTVRFNPFHDQGSNQSFATVLVNSKGDGVVISSIYARDKVSVYAKPLKGFASEYELSIEEKEAIKGAKIKA